MTNSPITITEVGLNAIFYIEYDTLSGITTVSEYSTLASYDVLNLPVIVNPNSNVGFTINIVFSG